MSFMDGTLQKFRILEKSGVHSEIKSSSDDFKKKIAASMMKFICLTELKIEKKNAK